MKEKNSKPSEREAVVDFHMDPKPVSGEGGPKEQHGKRQKEHRDSCGSPPVSSLYLLTFFPPLHSLPFSFSSFDLIKLSRSYFYSGGVTGALWHRCREEKEGRQKVKKSRKESLTDAHREIERGGGAEKTKKRHVQERKGESLQCERQNKEEWVGLQWVRAFHAKQGFICWSRCVCVCVSMRVRYI